MSVLSALFSTFMIEGLRHHTVRIPEPHVVELWDTKYECRKKAWVDVLFCRLRETGDGLTEIAFGHPYAEDGLSSLDIMLSQALSLLSTAKFGTIEISTQPCGNLIVLFLQAGDAVYRYTAQDVVFIPNGPNLRLIYDPRRNVIRLPEQS